ncbi:hypothetical protein M758_UG181200 [Ceratodon purpureus]|nr:hypothetical protein M758_UG181200 [Ceratodon purpureus]
MVPAYMRVPFVIRIIRIISLQNRATTYLAATEKPRVPPVSCQTTSVRNNRQTGAFFTDMDHTGTSYPVPTFSPCIFNFSLHQHVRSSTNSSLPGRSPSNACVHCSEWR